MTLHIRCKADRIDPYGITINRYQQLFYMQLMNGDSKWHRKRRHISHGFAACQCDTDITGRDMTHRQFAGQQLQPANTQLGIRQADL